MSMSASLPPKDGEPQRYRSAGASGYVPQKNNDKKFDFTKDPIEAYIDGEWVTANGTTLGADNGIGAAAILAVLEDDTLEQVLSKRFSQRPRRRVWTVRSAEERGAAR